MSLSASATHYMVRVKDKTLEIFHKIDHSAIYLLIAGMRTWHCKYLCHVSLYSNRMLTGFLFFYSPEMDL